MYFLCRGWRFEVLRVLVIVGTLGVALVLGVSVLRALFDTSEVEKDAKALIGKPVAEVSRVLGLPSEIVSPSDFNGRVRNDIQVSFEPKDIPRAEGSVLIYERNLTILILFERNGIIHDVYVGKT